MRGALLLLGLLLGLLAAAPLGCGGGPESVDNRAVVRRGFKFVLPAGEGWVTREEAENQSYSLVSRRVDGTFAETVSVHSGRHPFQFVDAVDFGDQMAKMVRRSFEDERYRVGELDIRLDDRFGPLCVRRWSVVQDARAQGMASLIPLEVRTLGYTFALPSDRGRLVHLEFAVRGTAAEVSASNWLERAEAFMGGIDIRGGR